jgi:hypothetical protein
MAVTDVPDTRLRPGFHSLFTLVAGGEGTGITQDRWAGGWG